MKHYRDKDDHRYPVVYCGKSGYTVQATESIEENECRACQNHYNSQEVKK